jgi:hypothetical protein
MNINELFGTRINTDEVKEAGGTMTATITSVEAVEFEDENTGKLQKKGQLNLDVAGAARAFVLNKTNASMLAESLGGDTTGWTGAVIELYADKTQFGSKKVDCTRVRFTGERSEDIPF